MGDEPLEFSVHHFRSDLSRDVERDNVRAALNDALDVQSLACQVLERAGAQTRTSSRSPQAKEFRTNQDLWKSLIDGKLREGSRLLLKDFSITEWMPLAPGRYFTSDAKNARKIAQEYFSYTNNEYLPVGKVEMVLGGIGSIRLKALDRDGRTRFLLGASSNGICHQGIGIAVPEDIYNRLIDDVISFGGCNGDILGRLQVIPPELSMIVADKKVPKYYLIVDAVENSRPVERRLLCTVSVMYAGSYDGRSDHVEIDGYTTDLVKRWTFCSFDPGKGKDAVQGAAAWLQRYAVRYSGSPTPVLSDFDEHQCYFDQPVEFPIGRIARGGISIERLCVYGDFYGFKVRAENLEVRGDNYKVQYAAAMGRGASAHGTTFIEK
jgi:hypothetical protein